MLRNLNSSVTNKLGAIEFEVLYEHLQNIIFLSKKGRKSQNIIDQFCNEETEEASKVSPKEMGMIKKLFTPEMSQFLSLKYPTNYFKAAIVMNIYPIPMATIIILMIGQRLKGFFPRNVVLCLFFIILLFLLILILLDFFLYSRIRTLRMYRSSKQSLNKVIRERTFSCKSENMHKNYSESEERGRIEKKLSEFSNFTKEEK